MEQKQTTFEGWAILELFGHNQLIGFVTTEYFGPVAMFRVEVPSRDAGTITLKRPQWVEGSDAMTPAGTVVQVPERPGLTKFVGPSALYAMTPCTQEIAMEALERLHPRELRVLGYTAPPLLEESGIEFDDENESDEDDEDDGGSENDETLQQLNEFAEELKCIVDGGTK